MIKVKDSGGELWTGKGQGCQQLGVQNWVSKAIYFRGVSLLFILIPNYFRVTMIRNPNLLRIL